MGIKQICDRCGTESESTDFNPFYDNPFPDDAFRWVTIKGKAYLLCPKCVQGYDALFADCQARIEDVLFQWVNKGGKE